MTDAVLMTARGRSVPRHEEHPPEQKAANITDVGRTMLDSFGDFAQRAKTAYELLARAVEHMAELEHRSQERIRLLEGEVQSLRAQVATEQSARAHLEQMITRAANELNGGA